MKILNRTVANVYRFKCEHCRSEFEMTEQEKLENDWEFTDKRFVNEDEESKLPVNERFICNRGDQFHCPVCGEVRTVRRGEMHYYAVYEDGTELKRY